MHAKYIDIDNAGYTINIGMEALIDEIKLFFIQIKYKNLKNILVFISFLSTFTYR